MKHVAKAVLIFLAAFAVWALVLVFFLTPASAIEVHGNVIVLDEEDIQACRAEGGCKLITKARMKELQGEGCKKDSRSET
jgi:cell division septal protein FtsQ